MNSKNFSKKGRELICTSNNSQLARFVRGISRARDLSYLSSRVFAILSSGVRSSRVLYVGKRAGKSHVLFRRELKRATRDRHRALSSQEATKSWRIALIE